MLTGLALFWAVPSHADELDVPDAIARWHAEIAEASARFGVPEVWIERVMRAESRGHTTLDGRPITSRAGAMGLMQLMPGTWADLRQRLGLGFDPHAPRDNILAGAAYLREMYDRFGYPGLFGAYNAGPARYAASLADGRPLPAETQAYLAKVAGGIGRFARTGQGSELPSLQPRDASPEPSRQTVFVFRSEAGTQDQGDDRPANTPKALPVLDPLFVVRNP